jgi:hypothetical protein
MGVRRHNRHAGREMPQRISEVSRVELKAGHVGAKLDCHWARGRQCAFAVIRSHLDVGIVSILHMRYCYATQLYQEEGGKCSRSTVKMLDHADGIHCLIGHMPEKFRHDRDGVCRIARKEPVIDPSQERRKAVEKRLAV